MVENLAQTYAVMYTMLMKTLSTTDLRANLSASLDQVNDDHTPIIVTRAKGKPAVLISLEDFAALEETAYLLRSPKNASRLRSAIAELEDGGGQPKTLAE